MGSESKAWIFYATITGICYGLGNTIFAVGCSKLGFWGATFTGPSIFILTLLFRIVGACRTKCSLGTFIEWDKSNYWEKIDS